MVKTQNDAVKVMIKLKKKLGNDGHTWRMLQCDSEKVLVLGKVKEFLENNNIQLTILQE